MPHSAIIHLPSGPVPVYALRLMESLKENGINHVSISVSYEPAQLPPENFPRRWRTTSTEPSAWPPQSSSAGIPGVADIHVILGNHTSLNLNTDNAQLIHCSLTSGAAGSFFPEIIHALHKGDGFTEVNVVAQNTLTGKASSFKGCFKTIPHSYQQTLELAIGGTIGLLVQAVMSCTQDSFNEATGTTIELNPTGSNQLPSDSIKSCIKKVRLAGIRKRFQQAFTIDRWNIGIIDAPLDEVALSTNKKWAVSWLDESGGTVFRADPFGITAAEEPVILFEHMQNGRGRIHALKRGKTSPLLAKEDTHFSYPYTFIDEGITYLVPESSRERGLWIYPIDTLSLNLGEPIHLPLGIHAVDPSIIKYNNRWWLFCTDRAAKGADTRLHLFFAERPTGPWTPHNLNPVKTDIRSARPAGHLFIHEGILYRPSQDSSIAYGGRIIINRIDEIDTDRFSETPINIITPENLTGRYNRGTHTISALGNKTCIDGKRKVFHPFALHRFFT